jgi:starch-binding outer membrane protein, SusD/RagB family
MVHRRGYGENPYGNSNVDYDINNYNMESFCDLIFQEKMYETIWEGKRWLDLKRIGKVKEAIMEAYGINVADKHMWWPIPENEFEYNDAIDPEKDQNFGY